VSILGGDKAFAAETPAPCAMASGGATSACIAYKLPRECAVAAAVLPMSMDLMTAAKLRIL